MNLNKNKKGFTLVEMLASVIVVVLLTMVLTVLTGLATKYYTSTSEEAHAQSLASTLSNAIEDELRYAINIEVVSDVKDLETIDVSEIDPVFNDYERDYYTNYIYFSSLSGMGSDTTIVNAIREINGDSKGTIVLSNGRTDTENKAIVYPIINDGDYVYGLRSLVISDFDGEKFNVTVVVKNASGRTLCENNFAVDPINPGE